MRVEIYTGDGDDVVQVNEVSAYTFIITGDDNDNVTVANSANVCRAKKPLCPCAMKGMAIRSFLAGLDTAKR